MHNILSYSKEGGNIVILACMAGNGQSGTSMAQALHDMASNSNIFLNQDISTMYGDKNYGLNIGAELTEAKNFFEGFIKIDMNGVISKVRNAVKHATGNIRVGRDGSINISILPQKMN